MHLCVSVDDCVCVQIYVYRWVTDVCMYSRVFVRVAVYVFVIMCICISSVCILRENLYTVH